MRTKILACYLDWLNNFKTLAAWRDHYNLSPLQSRKILRIGRELQLIAVIKKFRGYN